MSLPTLAEVAGLFDWLAVQAARLSARNRYQCRSLLCPVLLLRQYVH
jgi:hypothetical protein